MTEASAPKEVKVITPSFVVEARMKEYIKSADLHSTSDLVDELNKQVAVLLDNAIRRCKQNNRSTIQPKDL